MKVVVFIVGLFFILPLCLPAQQITFSEPLKEDSRDMNFDVIGKMKGNVIVFKNLRWKYALNIYNDSMQLKDKLELDFIPGKTFNVDFIAYPDFFYLIYQYQKKGLLYCMAVKMDANGKKINEPIQLDTTQIGVLGDNKIYSTINSDDKKKIILFKIQKRDNRVEFVTLLFDDQLLLKHTSRLYFDYNDRNDALSDFLLDNEGNFIFASSLKNNSRDNLSTLSLVIKKPLEDSFRIKKLNLDKTYLDEVKIKVDNVNNRYVLNSLFYKERNGNIEGLYSYIWDANADSSVAKVFSFFDEELKSMAKSSGNSKYAFNDFFIRNVILKRDGSYILMAEDYSSQSTGSNNWNRSDYLYGSPFLSPYSYYQYYPSYGGYYRPFNNFGNQSIRYYYENVLVISVDQNAKPSWTNVIHKQQFSDDTDNYLSFNTFITGSEIHFLFNDISKREKLLSDNIITADGSTKRSPTIKTFEKGYEFMPRFAKQTGFRQVILPCSYRGLICFAKIDF